MAESEKRIILLGPTASGKSMLALSLAEQLGGEILSVDSMQVYRGMDIGTAKPSAEERRRVPHHLIDLVPPTEAFTVAQFVARAEAVIAEVAQRDRWLIITGGTPMYYKALFEGLFEGPGADVELRQRLEIEPAEKLHERLRQLDPAAAARIHANDRRRLARALEVFEITGRPISSFQTTWGGGKHRHPARWFGLKWEKEELNRRINQRVRLMIDSGWLEEARGLRDRYGALSKTAAEATGYAELFAYLDGKLSLSEAIEQIKIATRQLARRQMKWFRRWGQIEWLPGNEANLVQLTLERLASDRDRA